MQEEQTFYPVTTEYFTACLPLLEKYFGITAGYFNKELSNAKCLIPHREGNIVKYSIKEDCNLVLPFRHLECHDLLSLINSYGTFIEITKGVNCYFDLKDAENAYFTHKSGKKPLCIGDELVVQISREAGQGCFLINVKR